MLVSTILPLMAQDVVFEGKSTSASFIELYSSEGCSSCPPAEAWLNKLKGDSGLWKDTFPVAFHVDYWDGLGWPDRFASSTYTQRQRDYATRLGSDTVYTPEFIVNGMEWRRSWLDGGHIPSNGAAKSGVLNLVVNTSDRKFSTQYTPAAPSASQPLVINVALLGFNLVTDVKRGENGGSRLHHEFVVLAFSSAPLSANAAGKFLASQPLPVSSSGEKPGALVAWISEDDGAILQVAGGWLPPDTHLSKE